MRWRVRPSTVSGVASVPGDKSIAHRALMLAALARGSSRIDNLPLGADVAATAACVRELGAGVSVDAHRATVVATGELAAPSHDLDARNSGTTMRLLAGLLAGQNFGSRLIGDASLSRRPMDRVVKPLRSMGARIQAEGGCAPLAIDPGRLHGIDYTLPIASAQVKSALLFAGLFASGNTAITEPCPSRDHSERMLVAAGVRVQRMNGTVTVSGSARPRPFSISIPGDISSAAFLMAAALLTGGDVCVVNTGVNATRTGFLDAIRDMGATIELSNMTEEMGEPVASVRVSGYIRAPIEIDQQQVPSLVDELPLIALLATQAPGRSTIRGAAELRVKETDRIAGVVSRLNALGADVRELADGMVITGPTPLHGARLDSGGDHRLAMMLAVAGLAADGEMIVEGAEAAAVSFPAFAESLRALAGDVDGD